MLFSSRQLSEARDYLESHSKQLEAQTAGFVKELFCGVFHGVYNREFRVWGLGFRVRGQTLGSRKCQVGLQTVL